MEKSIYEIVLDKDIGDRGFRDEMLNDRQRKTGYHISSNEKEIYKMINRKMVEEIDEKPDINGLPSHHRLI
jgi:hypothetical protein